MLIRSPKYERFDDIVLLNSVHRAFQRQDGPGHLKLSGTRSPGKYFRGNPRSFTGGPSIVKDLITLQFPNFSSMKAMVDRCSLLVSSFNILNYTITGPFPPELVNHAIGQLGASHFSEL